MKAIGISDVTLYTWLRKAGWKPGESKEKKLTAAEEGNRELKSGIKYIKPGRRQEKIFLIILSCFIILKEVIGILESIVL